jgi:hypothetical protein
MEINFKGMTRSGSERANVDGELAILMNGAVKDGTIVGIKSPDELDISVPTGGKLLFVHTTSDSTKNYIFSVGTVIYNGTTSITDIGSTINSVNALGNTLIALCDDGMHYFLWSDGAYEYLGKRPPITNIQFGLELQTFYSGAKSYTIPTEDSDQTDDEYQDSVETSITEQFDAAANEMLATANKNGRFIYPFFVRYAYRMYDGSHIMHSAPILMIPNSTTAPFCYIGKTTTISQAFDLQAYEGTLDYRLIALPDLSKWKDIIKGVDIYISAPLYTYNEAGKVSWKTGRAYSTPTIGKQTDFGFGVGIGGTSGSAAYYEKQQYDNSNTDSISNATSVLMPHFSSEQIKTKISECSLFYLAKKIDVRDLKTGVQDMTFTEDFLGALTSQETLEDDYETNDTIIPKTSYSYNNRLNIAGIKLFLFNGNNPEITTCANGIGYTCKGRTFGSNKISYDTSSLLSKSTAKTWRYIVKIKQNGKTVYVSPDASTNVMDFLGIWFYYPNVNATDLYATDGTNYYHVNLTAHSYLNGAYYFDGFTGNGVTGGDAITQADFPTVSSDKSIPILNKIYTSEISNPFYFPVKGMNTIGSSEILAIVSGTQPISQGQFGQFPLYAFTPDGIWALTVDDNGYYSSKQMASRDVILSKESICQIDGGVAYLTNQGLMLLVGGQSTNLSHALNGNPLTMDKLALVFGTLPIPDVNFKVYSSAAKVAYDYTNRRIVIFNPNYTYAYMYSIEEKTWSIIESNFSYAINTYPDCYLMNTNNKLVNLSKSNDYYDGSVNVALLTRSLGFNDGEVLKSISRLIVRGNIPISDKMILYGSRDLVNWFIVRSSTTHRLRVLGRSYKYFRLAYSATLENTNYVDGCSVEFEERYNDKIR